MTKRPTLMSHPVQRKLEPSTLRAGLGRTSAALLIAALASSGCGDMMAGEASLAAPLYASGPHGVAVPEAPTAPAAEGPSFVRTSKDAFSTFAADVDSASYDLFVSSMQTEGRLPAEETVRTEEFVNSFAYDYPVPDQEAEHPFEISVAAASGLVDSKTTMLRVGIRTRAAEAFEKQPTNLAFLIDTSGSMQDPSKLPLVQRLLDETLSVLDPEDTVAVVTYAGSTRVALPATPVSDSDRIREVIESLSANGSTAGASGLTLAYDEVGKNFIEGGINHVILCTDGDFNVGLSSTEELVTFIEEKRETGITFTAVGFGPAPNDAMLEAISNKGNGVYGVVATEEQVTDYAQNRMLSSLQLVAKDVKLQVEFNPEKVFAYRLVGYENRALADYEFYQDHVDAGEVGAGHRVTALYELALNESDLPKSTLVTDGGDADAAHEIESEDLVLVKVRYKHLDAGAEDESLEVRRALAASAIGDADTDMKWAAGVATFAEMLGKRRPVTGDALDHVESLLTPGASAEPRRDEFFELFGEARSLLE